jgi:hypothetical protein
MSERTCFVISTIGAENSDERTRADDKFDLVYKPVCDELGYNIRRADKETSPNLITRDIIVGIINSEMLIADVSDSNANVFYELAVRNAVKKPVVVVKNVNQPLPFDIYNKRAVSIDMQDPRQWTGAKIQLKEYIKNAETEPTRASESILGEFSFEIVSKIEGGVSDLSLQFKDLRDEVHSFIESSKSDRVRVPEIVTASGNTISPESITGNVPISGNLIPSVGLNWIPTQDNIQEIITKTLTRKCLKCGTESIIGTASGQCIQCSMTKKCSKCGQEYVDMGGIGDRCIPCTLGKSI